MVTHERGLGPNSEVAYYNHFYPHALARTQLHNCIQMHGSKGNVVQLLSQEGNEQLAILCYAYFANSHIIAYTHTCTHSDTHMFMNPCLFLDYCLCYKNGLILCTSFSIFFYVAQLHLRANLFQLICYSSNSL